jgi:hypothetical protein
MLGKYAFVPLAVGLMIGPTVAYEVEVHEFPRSSITLRGLPLPWNGDAPLGSGPPIDVFIVPALVDVVAYLVLSAIVWSRLYPRLMTTSAAVRVSIVALAWLYAIFAISVLSVGVYGFGGSWMLWYESHYYESLMKIGLSLGV